MSRKIVIVLRMIAGALVIIAIALCVQPKSNLIPRVKPEASPQIENFALMDHRGRFHELDYYSDKKAIVIISQGNGCPILRQSLPYLAKLKEEYEPRGVVFFMMNANPQDDRASLIREAMDFDVPMPILEDPSQVVAEMLNFKRTAEAVVIDPESWKVVYHGPIHDQFDYGTRKEKAGHHFLRDVMDAFLDGRPIPYSSMESKGCRINVLNPDITPSYESDVVPILRGHCVVCHRPSGAAPWSMDSYEKIKGWGAMIREVILTKRMPPWQADGHYGQFRDDISLSPQETRVILRWIETGYRRAEKDDPLMGLMPLRQSMWGLGEPDKILELKRPQAVAAEGADQFYFVDFSGDIERDVWIRAVDIVPTNPRVVHHVNVVVSPLEILTAEAKDEFDQHQRAEWFLRSGAGMDSGQMVAGYAPGSGPLVLPENTGIFLPAGSTLQARIHCIPTGRPEETSLKIGLYFYDQRPGHVLSVETINVREIRIPPGVKDYKLAGAHTFEKDVILVGLSPHMHYRGRSMKFIVQYPDGRTDILLSVPNYKFGWQRQYMLKSPLMLPAKTTIRLEAVYDNSAQNPDNPDPSQEVRYGPQSHAEMFTGILYFVERYGD